MKKSVAIHVIVMVIAVIIGAFMASALLVEQNKLNPSMMKLGQKSACGFNKFIADAEWMLFINYLGSAGGVKKGNADEFHNRLRTIIKNDPDFEKAYEIGCLSISREAPEKALELLKIGCDNPRLSSNWKIPALAGYVLRYNVNRKDLPALTGKLKTDAAGFFELAIQRASDDPMLPHLISALMREKAQKLGQAWKAKGSKETIKIINGNHALLCAWINESAEHNSGKVGENEMASYSIMQNNSNQTTGKILQLAINLKKEYPDDSNVGKTINELKANLLKGQNFCDKCMTIYAAGDKNCSYCGIKVAVYGECGKCGAVKKGAYCSQCGASGTEKL